MHDFCTILARAELGRYDGGLEYMTSCGMNIRVHLGRPAQEALKGNAMDHASCIHASWRASYGLPWPDYEREAGMSRVNFTTLVVSRLTMSILQLHRRPMYPPPDRYTLYANYLPLP